MRARGPLVHQRGGDAASGLGEGEEGPDLRWGSKGYGCGICHGCSEGFGVVFDFVFLFVEFVFAEEVVDGFIVLYIYFGGGGR